MGGEGRRGREEGGERGGEYIERRKGTGLHTTERIISTSHLLTVVILVR